MSDPETYSRRSVLKGTGAAAATVIGTAAVSGGATAQSDDPQGLFDDQGLSGRVTRGAYFVYGLMDGTAAQFNVLDDSSDGIETHVQAATDELETHSEDWVAYVNDRDLGGADRQTLAVTFSYRGETLTRYVNAPYDSDADAYTSLAVETPDEWGGDADHTATVSGDAVENAATELEELHQRFIGPNEDITQSYASHLAGRYYWTPNDHVSSSLLG